MAETIPSTVSVTFRQGFNFLISNNKISYWEVQRDIYIIKRKRLSSNGMTCAQVLSVIVLKDINDFKQIKFYL